VTESELAGVCWVRAVEQGAGEGVPWSDEDAAWASREARRDVGEGASAQAFVLRRARLATQRLAERDAAWRVPLQGEGPRAWRALLAVAALAIAAWIVGDVLGPSRRINLLAPPILLLLAWNLAVYAALPWAGGRGLAAWIAQAHEAARSRLSTRGVAAPLLAARARFAAEWSLLARGAQAPRVAALLHATAALLALAVIGSMYVFGLAFDYRAGWDSTWLGAEDVQRLLGAVFAPAFALTGIALPDAAELARLRFADGSAGERAGRWIHLYAVTLGLVVVLPRALLAAWALRRARRAAEGLALPLQERYFRELLRDGPAPSQPALVLPYSYTLGNAQRAALRAALREVVGPGVEPELHDTVPLGAEAELAGLLPAALPADLVLLFAATATPERETHGAFARAVAAAAPHAALSVVVDESGLRRHVGAAGEAELRLTQRRAAWQRMLHDLSLPPPHFVSLT
jgi:hypothetical protein